MAHHDKFIYVAYTDVTQTVVTHLVSRNVNGVTKEPWNLNDKQTTAIERIELKLLDALIIVINDDFVKSSQFVEAVEIALRNKIKIIVVHPVDSKFPSYQTISALPTNVKAIFDSIAVPYLDQFADECWIKIVAKLNNVVKRVSKVNWFLSHKQATGQQIALPLYLELKELGETAFLDIKTEFDLHDLEKIVELADIFCFIMSPGIFESDFCRKELEHAIGCHMSIVVIRPGTFQVEDIPNNWKQFSKFLLGSRTIVYYPQFLTQHAKILQSIRKTPNEYILKHYSPNNTTDFYPKIQKASLKWDTSQSGSNLMISVDGLTATKTSDGGGLLHWNAAVLGTLSAAKFSVKVENRGTGGIHIGMAAKAGFNPNANYTSFSQYHYSVYIGDGKMCGPNKTTAKIGLVKSGSIVTVELYNQTILYSVDGSKPVVGHTNVTKKVYPAIEIHNLNASVMLVP